MLNNEIVNISHKIELVPNNKAKTHFKKAFGCSRLAYNWGLSKWEEYYKLGIKKTHLELKKEFNSIKKAEFPFVYEVSKYATQQPFLNLGLAFQKFFRDLKQGKCSYPKYKSKKDNYGSYYIGGDQVVVKNEKYLKIPNFGLVKMREKLRFIGKINSVTISKKANKFYASFSLAISNEEYIRTHRIVESNTSLVGIDLGITSFAILSDGIYIEAPKPLKKLSRKIIRRQRQLSKKQHAKTKHDALMGIKKSNNYIKHSKKIAKLHSKIANSRNDFSHKLSTIIINKYSDIGIEELNVSGMMKNHRLAKSIADVSWYEFTRILEYKATYNKRHIHKVDRFYPSSKTCSNCGIIKQDLSLNMRNYTCENCKLTIDRDYNASLNMLNYVKKQIGLVQSEYTPVDLTALLYDLEINHIVTSKVEAGIQQKIC